MQIPSHVTRHFLTTDQPLLNPLARYLLEMGNNLKDCMVVVPTAHSGRQLRQALPTLAGRAVLAPSVITPEMFSVPRDADQAASKIEWWSAWSETLRILPEEELSAIFPNLENIERDFSWGLKAANRFCKLKEQIGSVNKGFRDVVEFSEEPARWEQLADIDAVVIDLLARRNLSCPVEAKRKAAQNWKIPEGVRRIVLACVPDLPLLARIALDQCTVPIDVLIHADSQLSEHFDPWGIPTPDYWTHCHLPLPNGATEEVIQIHATGHDACHALITECADIQSDQLALSVTDSSFASMVSDSFTEAGWRPFTPEGRAITKTGLWAFLRNLRLALVNPYNFQPVPSLIKSPEVLTLLPSIKSLAAAATEIDILTKNNLPQSLSHAIHCASDALKPALEELQAFLFSARNSPISAFAERLFDKLERFAHFPTQLIDPFLQSIESIRQLEAHSQSFSAHHALDLIMAACEGVRIPFDRSGSALDQLGWLELPYAAEPHLRIIGLHENSVPERPHDDGFLPESLREKIQLYSRIQLEARDSYIFHTLITARLKNASTKIHLSQTAPNGEERQASRLLLRCPAELLSSRVQHCFNEEIENKQSLPAYDAGNWKLQLDSAPAWPKDKELVVSPSRLKDFLHCPFRFYLSKVEGFNREEISAQELNAAQFGNLVHDVLEAFGRDPLARELSDAQAIRQCFEELLDSLFVKYYGEATSLPLDIQRESALRRLEAFAHQQATLRHEGWQIKHVELAIGQKENDIPWSIFDTPVNMRIDRIDIHETTGQWRVIDYKTSHKVKVPETEHLTNLRTCDEAHHIYGDPVPPAGGRKKALRRWSNLQLPLYAEFVRQHFSLSQLPEVGYVAFPAAASATSLQLWNGYDDDLHSSAMEWTQNVIQAIRSGDFPIREIPNDTKSWDRFAALSPEGLEHAFLIPNS